MEGDLPMRFELAGTSESNIETQRTGAPKNVSVLTTHLAYRQGKVEMGVP